MSPEKQNCPPYITSQSQSWFYLKLLSSFESRIGCHLKHTSIRILSSLVAAPLLAMCHERGTGYLSSVHL